MHVIYIHQYFTTKEGTAGTRSYEMSQRLLAAGHQVTMICSSSEYAPSSFKTDQRINQFDVDGIRVICIGEPYSNKMGFARRVLAFTRFAREATTVIKGLKPDLIFATSTPLTVGIPGMKGARYHRVPLVFEVRDLWPELPVAMGIVKNPVMHWYLARLERKCYFASQRVIALAPGIKDGILRTGYPEQRVAVIPNSCDLELFMPSSEPATDPRLGGQPNDFRIVFTGAHGMANGLDAVLDAVAELKKRGEKGIRFVFIGSGGQRERLMERSRSEGLDEMITWIKSIQKAELAQLLPRLDAGMMILKNVPAFYFGTSPNKFFDYISCGLPVLNNYPGWLAGLIEKNKCGVVVTPDDPAKFADAVVWLRDHPAERKEMGRRSRELAEREFSRDHMGTLFVQALESARDEFNRSINRH